MGNQQGVELKRTPLEAPCSVNWGSGTQVPNVVGREGHCSAVVNDKIYYFGGSGLNQLFNLSVYNPADNTIREITAPGPATACSASLNSVGEKLYLFGGLNRENGWNSDVWVFDTVTETWSKPMVTGIKPSPRDKHSTVLWGTKLVVFGGFGPASEEDESEEGSGPESVDFSWFKDTFTFDTATNFWEEFVPAKNGPTAVAAHSAGIYGEKMFVFGGKTHAARTQDLSVLDLTTREWSAVEDAGERPPPSSFHRSTQLGQFLVIYGGRANDNSHSSRLHVLDCESGGWYDPVEGDTPSSRGQASLSLLSNHSLVMFGGSGKFDPLEQCCQEFDQSFYTIDLSGLKPVTIPPPPVVTTDGMESSEATASGS